MLSIAMSTLRTRRHSLAGTFVALALGVAMTAAMGMALAATLSPAHQPRPQRFAEAPAVVRPDRTLAVGPVHWSLAGSRGLPPDLVARVGAAVPVVADRSFPAHVVGDGPSDVGHPWSVARFGGYRLTAGTAPRRAGEVVLAGERARPGDRVGVVTGSAQRTYTVSGTTAPAGYEHAVFFSDAEAARLSPRVDALAVTGSPDAARRAAGTSAAVLTGDARHDADPDPDRERRALDDTGVLLGVAAGIAGFVAVFVVASTFALAVAQRRRELALLRVIGATPRQIRRMLTAESLLLGVLASVTGCALAPLCARFLGHWLVDHRLAPAGFAVPASARPLALAFLSGPAVALVGVVAASRRAGRVRPAEALREAGVETRVMTPVRWLLGSAALGAGVATMAVTAVGAPASAANRKGYTPAVMLLITGAALLAPVLVPRLARLLTWPLARSGGATGLLVRENTLAAARRTASVAAPVLITVGLAGALLGTSHSVDATKAAEARQDVRADLVVRPTSGDTVSDVVLERVRAVRGVEAVPSTRTPVFAIGDGGTLRRYEARVVRGGDLGRAERLDVRQGSLAGIGENALVVDEEWEKKPGEVVHLWLADGTRTDARVAAVMRSGLDDGRAYLTAGHGGVRRIGRVDVILQPGVDRAAAARELRASTKGLGVEIVSARADAEGTGGSGRSSWLGILVTLGIALAYCGISVASTLAMAAAGRSRDQAVLRLSGATPAQVVRVALGEAVVVVCVGVVLALGVTALSLAGFWVALSRVTGATTLAVPWPPLAAAAAACALVALAATLVPTLSSLRTRPGGVAGLRG